MKILCLSNGHGEDAIALRILKALQQAAPDLKLAALPIVGDGHAFRSARIPIAGPTQTMPSGGFVYMDGKQLWGDVRGGLLGLTRSQLQVVRQWDGTLLAVGDIVPLLFAWLSGAPYAFVGTAKSEYYLRDEAGPLPRSTWFERLEDWSGSVYLPWERWLMSRPRCQAVFPRDSLTAKTLERWAIPAVDLGNPMMDGLPAALPSVSDAPHPRRLLLLPGSRSPEAERNWEVILAAVDAVLAVWDGVDLLAAIAPHLNQASFAELLMARGWQGAAGGYRRGSATLQMDSRFYESASQADAAIAMAGTATEQVVGLGKPVLTLAGEGPQFTPAFAEAQTRLLGPSVELVSAPENMGKALQALWDNRQRRRAIAANGLRRLGPPGAAARIAAHLLNVMA